MNPNIQRPRRLQVPPARLFALSVALAAVLTIAAFGVRAMLNHPFIPMASAELDITRLYASPSGAVSISPDSSMYRYPPPEMYVSADVDGNTLYICAYRALRHAPQDGAPKDLGENRNLPQSLQAWMQDGRMYTAHGADPGAAPLEITSIQVGKEGDFQTIWSAGDPLQSIPFEPGEWR